MMRWGFTGLLLCLLACLGMGAGRTPQQTAQWLAGLSPEDRVVAHELMAIDYHGVDRSFESREEMDFLVTPTLLVQDAISDDIVLTYPQE
jgi:hypothetical protein